MSEINNAPVESSESSNIEENSQPVSHNDTDSQDEQSESSQIVPSKSEKSGPVKKESPKPSKKKFKYKADGQEIEEELDDSEISNRLALSKAAQKRMQEAAETKKQTQQLIKMLQENPLEILNDDRIMGQAKFREIAERFLIEQLQLEQMSPEQKMQLERDKELERYKAEEAKRKQEEQELKSKQLEQQYAERFEKTIIDALNATNLPKNNKTVARMAQLLQLSIKNGLEADAQMLAQMAKDEYKNDLKSLVNELSAEQIIEMFGDDISNKLRKHDLSKLQIKNPVAPKPVIPQNPIQKTLSPREFDEQLRKKFSGS